MGTNYYIREKSCPTCNHAPEGYHIGKASLGWKFCFNGVHYKTFEEWKQKLEENKDRIFNEYGEKEDLEEFLRIIESKKDGITLGEYYRLHHVVQYEGDTLEWNDGTYAFSGREFS